MNRTQHLQALRWLLLCLAVITSCALPCAMAQDSSTTRLEEQVSRLQRSLEQMRAQLGTVEREQRAQRAAQLKLMARTDTAATLMTRIGSLTDTLHERSQELGHDLANTQTTLNDRFTALDERTGSRWVITLLLVGGIAALLGLAYVAMRKLLGHRVGAVGEELARINSDVQAKLVMVDTEVLTALDKLMHAKPAAPTPAAPHEEPDHSLALKVADEITRIEQNLAQMDPAVKGHKQLTAAVKRMRENLTAAGYELVEMLGKRFIDGMKVTATFIPDESLKQDEMIITRVFKPTVIFNGKMIQAGDIQVSQG